jgi:hypothetical protein
MNRNPTFPLKTGLNCVQKSDLPAEDGTELRSEIRPKSDQNPTFPLKTGLNCVQKSDQNPTKIRPKSDQNPTKIRPKSDQNPTKIRPKSDQNPTKIRPNMLAVYTDCKYINNVLYFICNV